MMRLIQRKNAQAKCNFCMEWMNLHTDIRLNINICNVCIEAGCSLNNLTAISSLGQIYQLYLVKQNSSVKINQTSNYSQSSLKDQEQETYIIDIECESQLKVEFLQQIDQYRRFQLQDILTKWQAITSFINQKEKLSTNQINYLKKLCTTKTQNLLKIHQQFKAEMRNQPRYKTEISEQSQNQLETILHNQFIERTNKQKNLTLNSQNCLFSTQQIIDENCTNLSINHHLNVISHKKRQGLRQKDLNLVDNNQFSDNLKQSAWKISNCSFYSGQFSNDESFFTKSQISRKINPIKYKRTNSSLTNLDKLEQRIRKQQLAKYKMAKLKVAKYLQSNYESSSLTRLMLSLVLSAYIYTSQLGKSLQLISFNLHNTDFRCFLEAFDWTHIQVVKIVNTKLSDEQFRVLVDFIAQKQVKIKALVLTNNKLTEKSIQYLYNNPIEQFKQIYLGKNSIKKFRIKQKIIELNSKYSLYL